jgi:serine/threonine protein kinase/peptidoglycan hydrolase-like protein with peptidoglycan-binding domain
MSVPSAARISLRRAHLPIVVDTYEAPDSVVATANETGSNDGLHSTRVSGRGLRQNVVAGALVVKVLSSQMASMAAGEPVNDEDSIPHAIDRTEHYSALAAGVRVGRYQIVSVLGQGAFGITYRAHDQQLDRDVAIKEYLPALLAFRPDGITVLPRSTKAADDFVWGRARFLDEAKTMGRLGKAPAIVRVYDFLEEHGTAYVVMELIEGETLEARLKRETRLRQPAIERLIYPLLDGLEQVHAAGFLHRDIKPANIILADDGSPTLIDFGASRASIQDRMQLMTAVLTPGYAPVEQYTSGQQGPWTDIYALAATLYACISGRVPRSAMDRMIGGVVIPSAVEIGKQRYAPSLLAAIDAGLSVRSDSRPQTIDQWRYILETGAPSRPTASAESDGATTQRLATPQGDSTSTAAASGRRHRMRVWLGGAIFALFLTSAGSYWAWTSREVSAPQSPAETAANLRQAAIGEAERKAAESERLQLEGDAQRKVETIAASKRAADAELAEAQLRQQKAEEELKRLKAEIETRRQAEAGKKDQEDAATQRAAQEKARQKAEVELAESRQAEEEAQRKAAAEAEAKRLGDEALARAQADRQRADEEAAARRLAEEVAVRKNEAETSAISMAAEEAKRKAEAASKPKADAEAAVIEKQTAEATENALHLTATDRQRIQVALTSLGHDTRGNDGVFGPRTREMIARWQVSRSQPATGFLTGTQQQALMRDAAAALSIYDGEQKKIGEEKNAAEDAKRKAEEEARTRKTVAPQTPLVAPTTAVAKFPYDGSYIGTVYFSASAYNSWTRTMTFRLSNGIGSGTSYVHKICGASTFTIMVSPSGDVTGEYRTFGGSCRPYSFSIKGRAQNETLELELRSNFIDSGHGVLRRATGANTERPSPN